MMWLWLQVAMVQFMKLSMGWFRMDRASQLGIIPIGSGNDFAYALKIPIDIPLAIDVIYEGHSQLVDLGPVADDRGIQEIFDNNLGIGFDANVVIRVEAIKRLHGFAKYFWGVLKTLALDFQTPSFSNAF